ncbi:P44/Msp2 family outer membrane protein [Hyphococcus flavus]|uniref:P44/Msp2 family outer membrane protein n=1 Tax=Hyphococcus flavus TaxID=1866326 RepID=A0AAF0CG10_9PROT|nr:P44/Msp2 family outer membrane protein [Hyphococcus flavus]WDI32981.1 P44/Msp2 family outer membrane protein [Hyphococcus flavus]
MRLVLALLTIAGTAVATGAAAQDDDSLGSVYVRASAGYSFVSDWEQDFAYNPDAVFAVAPPTGQTIDNTDGFIFGAALGFDYHDGIRTELEYRYAATEFESVTLADPVLGPTPGAPMNDDIAGHFLMTNFYFDFANDSPFTPFIGGGVGGAFMENENAQRDAVLAYQGRAGFSFAIASGFLADLEYVYTRTNELSFGPDMDDFEPGGPVGPNISNERYESSSAMISLRKHF